MSPINLEHPAGFPPSIWHSLLGLMAIATCSCRRKASSKHVGGKLRSCCPGSPEPCGKSFQAHYQAPPLQSPCEQNSHHLQAHLSMTSNNLMDLPSSSMVKVVHFAEMRKWRTQWRHYCDPGQGPRGSVFEMGTGSFRTTEKLKLKQPSRQQLQLHKYLHPNQDEHVSAGRSHLILPLGLHIDLTSQ